MINRLHLFICLLWRVKSLCRTFTCNEWDLHCTVLFFLPLLIRLTYQNILIEINMNVVNVHFSLCYFIHVYIQLINLLYILTCTIASQFELWFSFFNIRLMSIVREPKIQDMYYRRLVHMILKNSILTI